MRIKRWLTAFTLALGIRSAAIAAAQTNEFANQIPPLHPPLPEIPPTFWEQYHAFVWTGIAALFVVALVLVGLLRRRKPPLLPAPAAQARAELEQLGERAEDDVLLTRVSQVVRRYFSNAFGVAPGELTTAEFTRAIAAHERVGPALSGELSQFLRECDVRKFSPPQPGPPVEAVPRALHLIDAAESRREELRIADAAARSASTSSGAGRT